MSCTPGPWPELLQTSQHGDGDAENLDAVAEHHRGIVRVLGAEDDPGVSPLETLHRGSFVVESAAGSHPVTVHDDEMVRAFVGRPHQFRVGQLAIGVYTVVPVGVGNPHAVIIVESVDDAPVTEAGRRVEGDPMFPGGTNVEFVEVVDNERIRVRVWERGVGETRASGTGATAAAFVAHSQELTGSVVTVELPGGELEISLDDAGAWMVGPARVVYSGAVA